MINRKVEISQFGVGVLLFADDIKEYQCASKMIKNYTQVKSKEWNKPLEILYWHREREDIEEYIDTYILAFKSNTKDKIMEVRVPAWYLRELLLKEHIEQWKCKCIYCNSMMTNECDQEDKFLYFSCDCGAVYDEQGWSSREDLIESIGEN